MANRKPMDVGTLTTFIKNCKGFDKVIEKVQILSVGEGKCTAEFIVDETHLNPIGGLHGGFSATVVDDISTYALLSQTGVPGVSVDIHVSYLKGAKLGDTVLVEASVLKSGETIAFLEVTLKNKSSGEVLVKGSHTKFVKQK